MTCRLYYNGNLYAQTATAIATVDDRIVAVGHDADLCTRYSNANFKLDLQGKLVLPGFIESHAHFIGIGLAKLRLNVTHTTSIEEIARLVASHPKNNWVVGRGWDQNKWNNKTFPTHHALTEASPNHPVALTRIDGHALWCNANALQIAGLPLERAVLIDHDMELVTRHIPPISQQDRQRAAEIASREALSLGITSLHDAGCRQADIDILTSLECPTPRLNLMLEGSDEDLLREYFARGPIISDSLSIRSVKLYADGALGSRGAALLEPYSDDTHCGLTLLETEQIADIARRAKQAGFQICTHAIGDAANRSVLDAYEQAGCAHTRARIEHAQIVHPDDIKRFAKLSVIASVQPTHYTSDIAWAQSRLGKERLAQRGYPWRTFLNHGVILASGSDAPIEGLNPMNGLRSATTRTDDENLTVEQAMHAFTVGGAYAEFQEHQKGILAPGYLADFIVLEGELPNAQVTMTILNADYVALQI